jgi:hypothetical protein
MPRKTVVEPLTNPPAYTYRARVVSPVTIYGEAREVGSILEVDKDTFDNLEKKGRLEPVA